MSIFGLITEGVTDQFVLENILTGFFNDPNIDFRPQQPLRDATSDAQITSGNWLKVFEYCQSDNFIQSFERLDYLIIQIDTDVSEEIGFDIPKRKDGDELTPERLIEKVKEKFITLIGLDNFNKYKERIIFAICVHSCECWLLPLYYNDNRRAKTNGCLETLNYCFKKDGFTIDPKNKGYNKRYDEISKSYRKKKELQSKYQENPSLKIFVDNLKLLFPDNLN